ncbi:MAG TPA: hypothetical protein VIR34_00590 [Gemmatimonadaceae bacterium]
MNESLRDRILRRLDALPDERGYQVLDYVEFLESKYADKTAQTPNLFQRFTEGVEDSLRAGRVSASTIAETMGLLNKAMGVLSGVAAAGKSVASDVMGAATRSASSTSHPSSSAPPSQESSARPAPPPPPAPQYSPPPPPYAPPSPPAGPPPHPGEQRGSWPKDTPPGFGE